MPYQAADGGEVPHFCSECRPHSPDCEYYSDGGDVEETWDDLTPVGPGSTKEETWGDLTPAPTGNAQAEGQARFGNMQFQGQEAPSVDSSAPKEETWDDLTPVNEVAPKGALSAFTEGAEQEALPPGAWGALNRATGYSDQAESTEQAHPIASFTGKTLGFAANPINSAKVKAIGGCVKGAIQASNDSFNRSIAGVDSPVDSLGHMLLSGGVGCLIGGIGPIATELAAKPLDTYASKVASALGNKIKARLDGIKFALDNPGAVGAEDAALSSTHPTTFYNGVQKGLGLSNDLVKSMAKTATTVGLPSVGAAIGGVPGAFIGHKLVPSFQKYITQPIADMIGQKASPTLDAVISKAIQTDNVGADGIVAALNMAKTATKALSRVNKATLFLAPGAGQAAQSSLTTDRNRDKLKGYVENNGYENELSNMQTEQAQPQGFAEGGEVEHPLPNPDASAGDYTHLGQVFPDHQFGLNAAKGRMYTYLKSLAPVKDAPKLAFDDKAGKDPRQVKAYNDAINIALDPLSLMKHVQDGTLEDEHVHHLKAMYPEAYDTLAKKVTEHITSHQLKGTKPTYRIRQGLSTLLGVPMDSSMLPQSIMAVQSVFAQQSQTQPPKSDSQLTKAPQSAMTADQALEARKNRQG
jgi:hypothetical protein